MVSAVEAYAPNPMTMITLATMAEDNTVWALAAAAQTATMMQRTSEMQSWVAARAADGRTMALELPSTLGVAMATIFNWN